MRRAVPWMALFGLAACSDRPARERPRADLPPVQVVASPEAMPLVEVAAKEPNDDAARGTPLGVGERATDMIGGQGDVDVFVLTVTRPLTLRVALASPDDADLVLELADASGALIAASDRGPAGALEGLPNLSLPAGRFALTVREFVKKAPKPVKAKGAKAKPVAEVPARTSPSAPYTLAVTELAVSLADEREPNDDVATAGLLALAEARAGFIGWRGDADVWQLGMEGLGSQNVLDILVQPAAGTNTLVEVLTASGEMIASRKAGPAGLMVIRGLTPPAGGAWLRLSGTPANPEAGYEVQFTARFEATAEAGVLADAAQPANEREPNDAAPQATELAGPAMTAWLDVGDVDVFALPAADVAREIVVMPGDDLDVLLEELADTRVVQTANASPLGGSERLVLSPAATLVRVRAHKRRGVATAVGLEAQYQIQRLEVAATASDTAAPAVPVAGPP